MEARLPALLPPLLPTALEAAWPARAFMAWLGRYPRPGEAEMVRNTPDAWGWPAKLLHWLAAALILLLLGHGWWMTHLAARPQRLRPFCRPAAPRHDPPARPV